MSGGAGGNKISLINCCVAGVATTLFHVVVISNTARLGVEGNTIKLGGKQIETLWSRQRQSRRWWTITPLSQR